MENAIWIEDEFLKVDKLYDEGEFIECKRLLNYILEEEPGYGKAHNLLGWLYYSRLDDYKKAAYHFKLAVKFAPTYPPGFINYAYLLNYLNRHADLLAHAQEALKVEGVNKYVIHNEIGRSHEMNGHYKKATKAYKEAGRFAILKHEVSHTQESLERVKEKTATFQK